MLTSTPTVSVEINGHGTYTCFTDALDGIIRQYGRLTIDELHQLTYNRTLINFSGVRDRSALLVVIADYEGF